GDVYKRQQEAGSGEESFPSRGEFFVRRDQEMTVPGATAASEKGICSTRVLSVRELSGGHCRGDDDGFVGCRFVNSPGGSEKRDAGGRGKLWVEVSGTVSIAFK
ncbi:hypothetical protein, partial [Streptomyces scabiei]|uniref:hypothetical protein n=1 Tax=Streptomyces scabiei TaxID=1930 RepID=UPI0029A7B248